jgi:hypothetical protein
MIQNNFSVQIYDGESDNKLDILYINNIINLDDNDNDFEGYNINEIYYSIL